MLEWIKTFLVVYETQNFSLAAEQLFISQPTVSSQIKKLEEQLEVPLFLRKGKRQVVPTKEADFLYPKFLHIIEEITMSLAQAKEKENYRESCILACSHTTAIYMIPNIMQPLTEAFPLVNFSIQMMNSAEAAAAVQTNHAHIGLLEKPMDTLRMKKEVLVTDELVLAGNPDSKFWILREDESGIRFFNELYLNNHNLHLPIIWVNNNEVLMQLVKSSVGRSIVSKLSVSEAIHWEAVHQSPQKRDIVIICGVTQPTSIIPQVYEWIKQALQQQG